MSSDTYSFEDLHAYGSRLHINTALALIVNGFAAFIVVQFSTPTMEKYKYYILLTICTAFAMDFHMTAIYGPYPLFPFPGWCGAGIFKDYGFFWGECFHYFILHVTLSFAGISLLISFLYQYCSIHQNVAFFHSFKGILIIILIMLIYPIPPILMVTLTIDREETLTYVRDHFPQFYEFFVTAPCNGITFNISTVIYLSICVLQIILVYVLALIFGFKIHTSLSTLKNTLSLKTLKIRRQFLRSLILQLFVPFVFIVLPLVAVIICVILKVQNIKSFSQGAIQFLAFHSCFNSLTIIMVIKPYRQRVKTILGLANCWKLRNLTERSLTVHTNRDVIIHPFKK